MAERISQKAIGLIVSFYVLLWFGNIYVILLILRRADISNPFYFVTAYFSWGLITLICGTHILLLIETVLEFNLRSDTLLDNLFNDDTDTSFINKTYLRPNFLKGSKLPISLFLSNNRKY